MTVPARANEIFGSGEMADLTRTFDWSTTPVGPIAQWPDALLITVNTMLSSRHPMFLWWGEDLIQFYNDGYRPSIREDKHPSALGQRGEDCWGEIWPVIWPQIDAVMVRGEASWHENQLVPINRNGKLEDVYWTYGYSPVRDSAGEIRGTLVVCTETTDSVTARQQLNRERERLADLFQQAPAFFAVLSGSEHIFEMINPPYQDLIGQRSILGNLFARLCPKHTNRASSRCSTASTRPASPSLEAAHPCSWPAAIRSSSNSATSTSSTNRDATPTAPSPASSSWASTSPKASARNKSCCNRKS